MEASDRHMYRVAVQNMQDDDDVVFSALMSASTPLDSQYKLAMLLAQASITVDPFAFQKVLREQARLN